MLGPWNHGEISQITGRFLQFPYVTHAFENVILPGAPSPPPRGSIQVHTDALPILMPAIPCPPQCIREFVKVYAFTGKI